MNWFWHALWIALVVIPVALLWIACLMSVFIRKDLSVWARIGWVFVIFILPLFGSLIYLLLSPSLFSDVSTQRHAEAKTSSTSEGSLAEQMASLSQLHDAGSLTDAEFKTAKAGLLGQPSSAPTTPPSTVKVG